MLRTIAQEWLKVTSCTLAWIIALSLTVYFGTRIRVTYDNSNNIARLQEELQALTIRQNAREQLLRAELDEIERTLYSEIGKAPERRASTLEQWQINRDNEVKRRLSVLEAWRLRTDK